MEIYSVLSFVSRATYYAACAFSAWWFCEIINSIITHEKPSKEHILNLMCADILQVVCGIILSLYY